MARVPQVSRTMKSTKVTCLCVDIVTNQVIHKEFIVPRTYKSDKELMKALETVNEDEFIKIVNVESTEVAKQLYSMSEAEFIKYAKPIENR